MMLFILNQIIVFLAIRIQLNNNCKMYFSICFLMQSHFYMIVHKSAFKNNIAKNLAEPFLHTMQKWKSKCFLKSKCFDQCYLSHHEQLK